MTATVNSLWRTAEGQQFKITLVEHLDSDPWVSYQNVQTGQTYTCRLAAFLTRFSREP